MNPYRIAFILSCLMGAGSASAGLSCNSDAIVINDNAVAGTYPSSITTSGGPSSIISVTVQVNSLTHTFPDDIGIVLVGPGGQALLLQAGAGDVVSGANGLTYGFDDAAANPLPNLNSWAAGVYKPTNYYQALDNFPAPGPGTTYSNPGPGGTGTATFSSVFAGTNSNGTWNLFVADFASGDAGSIGGWCIDFTGTPVSLQNFSID